jgi:hypothetical protein
VNPYFDILAWTNQSLEWAGPEATTHKIKISHALLPVLYHHFSCVCPSFEALEIIRVIAKGRGVVDVGSGNGYWTYMLRRMKDGKKNLEVVPVDNGLSDWRTLWVADTVEMDGAEWLRKHDGGRGHVLLMVYPQVSHDFTAKTIKAYGEFFFLFFSSLRLLGWRGIFVLTLFFTEQMVRRLLLRARRMRMDTRLLRTSCLSIGLPE